MAVKLTIPMDDDLLSDIGDLATAEQRKKAPMGRILIREAIENRKSRLGITDAHPAPAGPVQDVRTTPIANAV